MERRRFYQPGGSVRNAIRNARYRAEQRPALASEVGKQLRRDVGNYLWRETGYNILLAVGVGGVMFLTAGLNEPAEYPYLNEAAAGFFVFGALVRESIALVNAGRLLKASFQYKRNPQPRHELALAPVVE